MPFKLGISELRDLRWLVEDIEVENYPKRFAGWVRICERVPVYIDHERLIVVKRPKFILNSRTPLKVRIPTIKLDDYWVVQPYAERYRRKEAVELLAKKLGRNHGCDLHHLNVGWYLGKPVMFDW